MVQRGAHFSLPAFHLEEGNVLDSQRVLGNSAALRSTCRGIVHWLGFPQRLIQHALS